ncbi:hypothetical protein, conserved [Trypanosoma brucei brucei TREU927]|uniref:Uncharacterized protein n=1 Tax=Trypanosoma brucei brucei (strain 927/4 GUTat10.1) TaxID=185431 RepID=Q57U58_TRYB2|nr:hypothetical protein, conserved [Trypanosoma brucei brucei TREU927]AAX70860.1 hypothetical protein, conserved [Trypanosoma brucei]AAZ13546.1 hypothetical protein, conserved [Trypanosoma brucei brucei TREU927]
MNRFQRSDETLSSSASGQRARRSTTGGLENSISISYGTDITRSTSSKAIRRRRSNLTVPSGTGHFSCTRTRIPNNTCLRRSSFPSGNTPLRADRTPSPKSLKRQKVRLHVVKPLLQSSHNTRLIVNDSVCTGTDTKANGDSDTKCDVNDISLCSTSVVDAPPIGPEEGTAYQQQENLTLNDVEELRRRREQLRYGVDTSLARIAELKLLTQAFRLDQRGTDGGDGEALNAASSAEISNSALLNSTENEASVTSKSLAIEGEEWGREEDTLLLLKVAEEEYEELRLQLTLACASLSAVPQTLWTDIRRFRQPPPAVAAVVDAVLILLGLPQSRHRRLGLGNGGWPNFPQQLIQCDPLATYQKIMGIADCESWMNGVSRMGELEHFLCHWTHLRVSRVHPTLGPLHQWVKTMVDASRAAGRLEALRDASSAKQIATVAGRGILLRELEENEEYVQLAQEEIAAIDALVADVVAFGVAGPAISSGAAVSEEKRNLAEPAEAYGEPSAQRSGGRGRAGKGVSWSAEVSNANSLPLVSGTEQRVTTAGTGRRRKDIVIPALNFADCLPSFPHAEQGPLSLRERFERIRTSSLCHSPRAGPISHVEGSPSRGNFGSVTEIANSIGNVSFLTTARALRDRENLLMRVHQLEEQLNEICGSKPKEVELVLLRDELAAAQEEISRLRAERDELEQRAKRRDTYYKPSSPRGGCIKGLDEELAGADEISSAGASKEKAADGSGDAMTVMMLEQQLLTAHARIQHLEATVVGLTSDEGTQCTSVSGSGNDSPEAPYDNSNRPSAFAASGLGITIAGGPGEVPFLQRRIDEMQRILEMQERAVNDAEERLNNEMHAKNEAYEQVRQLQAELRSVWQQLENSEYQLKVAMEGSRCYYCRADLDDRDAGHGGEDMRQQRRREAVCQEEIERLRMQLRDQKQRSVEERRRRLELRKVRSALLLKLENTFTEALRLQENGSERAAAILQPTRTDMGDNVNSQEL